jgi:two-component system chemotaxis sensor kinase CheA
VDMSKYRELFISETREHLRTMNELIVSLEKDGGDRENIDSLFRSAHSVKGMAASMGYGDIADLAHRMEDLMDRVRKGVFPFDSGVADLLLEGADCLETLVRDVEEENSEGRDVSELVGRISTYDPSAAGGASPSPSAATQTEAPVQKVSETTGGGGRGVAGQTVRVRTEILDYLINTTGELITNKHRLLNVGRELKSPSLDEAVTELSKLLRELYSGVISVRMMPFSSISDRFPRMVRDLAKKRGKEVSFVIEGEGIELDRGILEELADPLIHVIRNSIDHGLESAEERLEAGKPAEGSVRLSASREKDQVVIVVEDDGRGMDPAGLLKAAIEKGFLDPAGASALSLQETFLLTCIPGFSTAREVTDVSGRGVGMDSVNSTIRSLGGTLTIESELGLGSRIIIRLPLTISIINVLLAKVTAFSVAIPVTNITRTMEVRRSLITQRENREHFFLDDEEIPIFSLNKIFADPEAHSDKVYLPIFITEVKGRKVGFSVDRFLGQQEVFVKPLRRPLSRLRGFSGGAVLGDGEIVFVLDVANLL